MEDHIQLIIHETITNAQADVIAEMNENLKKQPMSAVHIPSGWPLAIILWKDGKATEIVPKKGR